MKAIYIAKLIMHSVPHKYAHLDKDEQAKVPRNETTTRVQVELFPSQENADIWMGGKYEQLAMELRTFAWTGDVRRAEIDPEALEEFNRRYRMTVTATIKIHRSVVAPGEDECDAEHNAVGEAEEHDWVLDDHRNEIEWVTAKASSIVETEDEEEF